ncbi:MAG: hypothetical protein IAG13_05415 [Deltaproteobacteria bacterium]|nr:hypothetical protein [Nannocystaceae bacterium]
MAEPVQEELDRLGRGSHGLLIDSRDAPRRNDPAYESWFAKHRVKMIIGFPRVAVLVKSMAGLLQTQRLSTDGGLTNVNPHVRSFNHEADAWAYARGET